jgi:hypothetical protein
MRLKLNKHFLTSDHVYQHNDKTASFKNWKKIHCSNQPEAIPVGTCLKHQASKVKWSLKSSGFCHLLYMINTKIISEQNINFLDYQISLKLMETSQNKTNYSFLLSLLFVLVGKNITMKLMFIFLIQPNMIRC